MWGWGWGWIVGLGLDLSNRVHLCELTTGCASTRLAADNIHPQIRYSSSKQGSLKEKVEFTWTAVEHTWSGGKILPENPLFRCDHIVNQGWP